MLYIEFLFSRSCIFSVFVSTNFYFHLIFIGYNSLATQSNEALYTFKADATAVGTVLQYYEGILAQCLVNCRALSNCTSVSAENVARTSRGFPILSQKASCQLLASHIVKIDTTGSKFFFSMTVCVIYNLTLVYLHYQV